MARAFTLLLLAAAFLSADSYVLVSANPWGKNRDVENMTDVFGAGNFTTYTSFAAAEPASIFTPATRFVFLEGGAQTDNAWRRYVLANELAMLNWVQSGGALLLMSAGLSNLSTAIGPGTLTHGVGFDMYCGTLTASGKAALPGMAAGHCGNYLAHNLVAGDGLTVFMRNSAGLPILAGTYYGAGYIMYSGLTNSQWHTAGPSLINETIRYTADRTNVIPEPSSVVLLASVVLGIGFALRRRSAAAGRS